MDAKTLLEKYVGGQRKFHSVNLGGVDLKSLDLKEIDLYHSNLN
jgi:uncharacterized protein YjbI with pentapeptide repeats